MVRERDWERIPLTAVIILMDVIVQIWDVLASHDVIFVFLVALERLEEIGVVSDCAQAEDGLNSNTRAGITQRGTTSLGTNNTLQ